MRKSFARKVSLSWALGILLCAWPLFGQQKVGQIQIFRNAYFFNATCVGAATGRSVLCTETNVLKLSNNNGAFAQVATHGAASIPDSALSSNVALLNRTSQEFTSTNTFSGVVSLTGTGERLTFGSAGSSSSYQRIANTGGGLVIGQESSSGGSIITGTTGYAAVVGTNSTNILQLATNNAVRATIDANGQIGIGVSPSTTLHIKRSSADATAIVEIDGGASTTGNRLIAKDNGTEKFRVEADGDVVSQKSYFESGRSTAVGYRAPARTFSAGNFTCTGGGSWTLASGDVTTETWTRVGETLLYMFRFDTTTISGTCSILRITLPDSLSIPSGIDVQFQGTLYYNGTAWNSGVIRAITGTQLELYPNNLSGNWPTGTDNIVVTGLITVPAI